MQFQSHAKWILSGEHAVIRGGKAIAFPLKGYKCTLGFSRSDRINVTHDVFSTVLSNNELNGSFVDLLKEASEFLNVDFSEIRGLFSIHNNILMNAGLGSSAAICANVAKLFAYLGFTDDTLLLAKNLENHFHKKSSGLDVAVAVKENPVIFQKNRVIKIPKISFWPEITLTYSGPKMPTSLCTKAVAKIFRENESVALELDNMMNEASDLCESALETSRFDLLKDGINFGNEVFRRWGLINEQLETHMSMLKSKGAVASKPTGSGLGGYVVSLWETKPAINAIFV